MLRRRQFSLAYLLALVTGAALVIGLVRNQADRGQGEHLMHWISGATILLVAALTGGLSAWTLLHAVRVRLWWPKTSASVTRYVIRRHEGQRFYHPVVRFETDDGRQVTAISASGWWRPSWARGAHLPVRYHPQEPRWVEIVSDRYLAVILAPLVIFGLLVWLFVTGWR